MIRDSPPPPRKRDCVYPSSLNPSILRVKTAKKALNGDIKKAIEGSFKIISFFVKIDFLIEVNVTTPTLKHNLILFRH